MGIIVGILTGILILLCIFLVLIILMQKSKQEAGLGAAFGGAATEQIFGAGTTSVLTKATIWGTAIFFIITLVLAIIYSHEHKQSLSSRLLSAAATNETATISSAPSTNASPGLNLTVDDAAKPAATNEPPALTETNAPATK